MAQLRLQASNIKCGGCVEAIRSGLTPLPGVDEVEVDIKTGAVAVTGEQLDEQHIVAVLAELGYPPTNVD